MNDKEATRPTSEQIQEVRQDALLATQHSSVSEYFQRLGAYTLAILDDYERLLAQEKTIISDMEKEREIYAKATSYEEPYRSYARGNRRALAIMIGRLTGTYPEE
jgi:hypothetical protein